jgi:hypothetical protein
MSMPSSDDILVSSIPRQKTVAEKAFDLVAEASTCPEEVRNSFSNLLFPKLFSVQFGEPTDNKLFFFKTRHTPPTSDSPFDLGTLDIELASASLTPVPRLSARGSFIEQFDDVVLSNLLSSLSKEKDFEDTVLRLSTKDLDAVFLNRVIHLGNLIFRRTRRRMANFLLFHTEDLVVVEDWLQKCRPEHSKVLLGRHNLYGSPLIDKGEVLVGSSHDLARSSGLDTGYIVAPWKVIEESTGTTFYVDCRLVEPNSYIKTKLVLED